MSECNTPEDKPAVESWLPDAKLLLDVGLDGDGRAHFLDTENDRVVVTPTDRRGRGIDDVDETHDLDGRPLGHYLQFVGKGPGWREIDRRRR